MVEQKESIKVEVVPGYPQLVTIDRNNGRRIMTGPTEAVIRLMSKRDWDLSSPEILMGHRTSVKRKKAA